MILMVIYVETLNSDLIAFICNIVFDVTLTVIFSISQFIDTDFITPQDERKNGISQYLNIF